MHRFIVFMLLIIPCSLVAQTDPTKWLRAFPITDYMVDLDDSTKVVQLEMPDGVILKEKQLGMVWGVFEDSKDDAVQKGYGRCQLIKGNYYYFAIRDNKSGLSLKQGDLIYTFMDTSAIYYGRLPRLAGHFIRLQNVYENNFYDRYTIFRNWTLAMEGAILDSMIHDIRFTGRYFLENAPSMNKLITDGELKGMYILDVMKECKAGLLEEFFDYILARPRLYAGKQWKLSEIFATWLANSAPRVIKE